MADVPSMWRVELIHPLVVHFPLALLLVGAAVRLAGFGADALGRGRVLTPSGRLLLVLGVPLAWAAVYTGLLANAEVARALCDPTVKRTHEELAWVTASLFTAALAIDLGGARLRLRAGTRTIVAVLVAAGLVGGAAVLGYTGHLGSRLVYQQAAAVYHPSAQCTEFE